MSLLVMSGVLLQQPCMKVEWCAPREKSQLLSLHEMLGPWLVESLG